MSKDLWLVVGLGNPGSEYAGNRHNVGHMVLAELAYRVSARFTNHRAGAAVAEGRALVGGPRLVLAKPARFMNVSGGPVASLLNYLSLDASRLIVAHDELDVPFDTIKLKYGGGHGGHNGVRDVIASVGTGDFFRVRVGIGRPLGRQSAADYVLHDFAASERRVLPDFVANAADAVETIASEGLDAAQQKFHAPARKLTE